METVDLELNGIVAQRSDFDRESRLSDALHRSLIRAGNGNCWLVIDPTIRPLKSDEPLAVALAEAEAEICRLGSPHRAVDQSLMPCLARLESATGSGSSAIQVALAEACAELDSDALMRGGGRRIGGWLDAHAPGPALANHMASHMIQRRANGRTTLFRWTDPAVLWAMWPALDGRQRAALLGPIDCYHLLDPAGNLVELTAENRSASEGPAHEPMAMTERQWQLCDSVGALNLALLEVGVSEWSSTELRRKADIGLAALVRARHLGFDDTQDLASFARRAMSVCPAFDAHPLVADRLGKRGVDDYFTSLVEDLKDVEWSRIAREASGDRQH